MKREPNWMPITRISDYEEELDVNAAPDAPEEARLRHRLRSFTGQSIEEWQPGPAPRSGK